MGIAISTSRSQPILGATETVASPGSPGWRAVPGLHSANASPGRISLAHPRLWPGRLPRGWAAYFDPDRRCGGRTPARPADSAPPASSGLSHPLHSNYRSYPPGPRFSLVADWEGTERIHLPPFGEIVHCALCIVHCVSCIVSGGTGSWPLRPLQAHHPPCRANEKEKWFWQN